MATTSDKELNKALFDLAFSLAIIFLIYLGTSCQSTHIPLTPAQTEEVEELYEDIQEADQILTDPSATETEKDIAKDTKEQAQDRIAEIEAGNSQGFIESILKWIPGVRDFALEISILLSTLLFRRPRELYASSLKNVGKAALAVNPLNSKKSPGEAGESLINAARDLLAIPGLLDRRPDPKDHA